MLVRRILNMVEGMHLENKIYLKQSLWASTFIQDENSKMKYWEHVLDKDTGNFCTKKFFHFSYYGCLKSEIISRVICNRQIWETYQRKTLQPMSLLTKLPTQNTQNL